MATDDEPQSAKASPDKKSGPAKLILPVLIPVVIATLVSTFTPVGEGLRNSLFPSSKTVRGSVKLSGQALAGAKLTLDGDRQATTDATGSFALTKVRQGDHVLVIEALNAQRRDVKFPVTRGADSIDLGALDVVPALRVGMLASALPEPDLGSFAIKLKYDVTLWLEGDAGSLGRVAKVTYSFPPGYQLKPAVVSSPANRFCHHRTGTLADATKAVGQLSASVTFKDGKSLDLAVPGMDQQGGGSPPGGCS